MVPEEGVEPPRACAHGILSPFLRFPSSFSKCALVIARPSKDQYSRRHGREKCPRTAQADQPVPSRQRATRGATHDYVLRISQMENWHALKFPLDEKREVSMANC